MGTWRDQAATSIIAPGELALAGGLGVGGYREELHVMAFEPLHMVELTTEEQAAASAFIRGLAPPGEVMMAREEISEELKRGLIAVAMFDLADRLTTEGRMAENAALMDRGCSSAVKAFALYPIAVNCYECARILAHSGRADAARTMFEEFLRRASQERPSPVRDRFTADHDMSHLESGARLFLSTGIVPVT